MRVSRASSPRRRRAKPRQLKPSANRERQIPSPFTGLQGQSFDFRHSREGGNPEGTRGSRAESSIRNQARIASDKSLPPLWGKARMGVRRAQARLCGRDARAPIPPTASAVCIPAFAGMTGRGTRRLCQNQDSQDWRDFQDFIVVPTRFSPQPKIPPRRMGMSATIKDAPVKILKIP